MRSDQRWKSAIRQGAVHERAPNPEPASRQCESVRDVTWIDLVSIVVIIVYGVGGFFSGVVRRLIGFIALYLAVLAATNMGLQAGGILQQTSNFETSTRQIYVSFGILVPVLPLA